MDEFDRMTIKIIIGTVLGIFFIFWVISFSAYKYSAEIAQANIISIYKENILIYKGKKAFVGIESGGMTTTIKIYKKLFPFVILDRVYSDKAIRIE